MKSANTEIKEYNNYKNSLFPTNYLATAYI